MASRFLFSSLLLVVVVALLASSSSLVQAQSCNATQPSCTSTVAVPTPWFSLTFDSAPPTALTANVPWLASDTTDPASCYQHKGVMQLMGNGISDGSSSQYIDLLNSSSPNTVGSVFPGNLGGPSAGSVSAGTAGWTIEATFKATAQPTWAKLFDLAAGAGVSSMQIEWSGSSTTTQYTIYDVTQASGSETIIQSTQLGTWYHVAVVLQQMTSTITPGAQAAWFVYLNGALSAGTNYGMTINDYGAYQFYPQNVARQFGYLGRSTWSGDALYSGLIDSFKVYNYALSGSQVTTLYQNAMGGCALPAYSATAPADLSPSIPLTTSTTAVSPTYAVEFANSPAPAGVSTGYQWLAQDQDDAQCGLNTVHTGLVYLADQTQVSEGDNVGSFSYVDLGATNTAWALSSTASSPNGPMSQTFVGNASTTGSVTAGTAGFSMEVTFKPVFSTQWSKLIDFGQTRTNGNCNFDVVLGVDNLNQFWQLEACDGNGNQYQITNVNQYPNAAGQSGFLSGSWYHVVVVFQQLVNGNADWYVFVNNQLVSTMTNTYMPPTVTRQNLWLGRSGWGDTLWSGEIDNFRYYPQALGPNQISTLYSAAMGSTGLQACVVTAQTTSLIPAGAVFFSATFDVNPNTLPGVPSTTNYSWNNVDTSDVVAGTHQGILVLNGCTAPNCGGNFVNLSAATGVNSIGQVLPAWGGLGTGSFDAGTVGWSFEVTWKAYSQQQWAKLFDLGAADGGSGGQWDVYFGWNNQNQYMTVTTTNLYNTETGVGTATPNINFNVWYHTVWVIKSSAGSTSAADFTVYTNGAQSGQTLGGLSNGNLNTYYPPLVVRANSLLGQSNWPGTSYFVGEIDTFRIYSIALNPNQVNALYEKASVPPGGKVNNTCIGAGFDMTSIGNQDYVLNNYNGYNWIVRPCGYIDLNTCAPGASFCQNNNVVSYFEPTLNPILWQRITNGVQLSVTDGAQCGGASYGRTGIVRFICSESAQQPYFSQVNEVQTCTYVAIIETVLACQVSNPNLITAVGEPFASPVCGGGLYDLSSLNTQDLAWTQGYTYWLRPCQTVSNSSCASVQPTSFCQSGPQSVANYAATSGSPTVYTLTQQTGSSGSSTYGLTMQIADGSMCNGYFPRVGIINFVCNPSATTAVLTSVVESAIINCHYTATVSTSVVCGAPLATNGGLTGDTQRAPVLTNQAPNTYAPTCGGAGFDVSQSNTDMFYQQFGGYTYYVHPCGNFVGKQPCPAGVSMCQVANDGSASYYIASRWNASQDSSQAQWLAVPNGVQMTIATGDGCGGAAQARYAVLNFVCDTSAVNPQLSYIYEIEECHYEAYIATVQACTQYQALLPSHANAGQTWTSNICGGGVYPLSTLSAVEFYQNVTATSTFSYILRVCANVQNPNCAQAQPTSFCQYQGQPPSISYPYSAGAWSPSNTFNQWQTTSNGIVLYIQDGTQCSVINNAPRQAIYNFTCDPTATTPRLIGAGVSEIETCHYTAYIATNLVCPNMLQLSTSPPIGGPTSSSTGAAQTGTTSTGGLPGPTSSGYVTSSSVTSGAATVVTTNTASSSSNSLSGGKLAAAIVVPIIGAVLVACLCFLLGRIMSGNGGKTGKMDTTSRNSQSHQPHYDEPSQAGGEQSTNQGVEMA